MSFLNGIFLLALPLAAVPVVLHFYRRQQRDVIEWGAMRFLLDASKQGRRRERLEEILLMLMRCALVLALVLALSRPQLQGYWFGERASREVILVLDNSMSMSFTPEEDTVFSELKVQAHEVINQLTGQDAVQVMLAAGGPDWRTPEALPADDATKSALLNLVEELEPGLGAADLLSSIQAAVDAAPAENVRGRHIVVITDCQSRGWQLGAKPHWERLKAAAESNDVATSVQIVTCGVSKETIHNLAVMNVQTSTTQVSPGQVVELQATLQNLGEVSTSPTVLEQLVNGKVAGTSDIPALGTGESTAVSWQWTAAEPGVYSVACRAETGDQLTPDDEAAVIIEVVERIPVLIVEGVSEYRERMSDANLLTKALGYDRDTPHEHWHAVFAPEVISPGELEDISLAKYQAVVITNLTSVLSSTTDKLTRYVEQGGGLWLVPGRRTDLNTFNSVWFDDGGGLSPLPMQEQVAHKDEAAEEMIHPPSTDHQTTIHLADTNRLDIDVVRIRRRFRFDRQTADEQLSVLLETGDGDPLAVEQYIGRGRVIVQGLPFSIRWSNLPLSKSFVVMAQDWLGYLTQPAAIQFNLPVGGRIELPISAAHQPGEVTLVLPDGQQRDLPLQEKDNSGRYRYSQTQAPGRYEIRCTDAEGTTQTTPFQVERDAQESDLTAMTEPEQQTLATSSGVLFSGLSESGLPEFSGTDAGGARPVWNSLLVALLVFMAVELMLATRSAKARTPKSTLPVFESPGLDSAGRSFTDLQEKQSVHT